MLITGGAGSLGKFLVSKFCEKMNVIVVDRLNYKDSGYDVNVKNIDYYSYDLGNLEGIPALIDQILKKHESIDILINNVAVRKFKKFDEFSDIEIDEYIKINLTSVMILTKHVLKSMKKCNYGRIIIIASKSAYQGYRTGSLYCSTKSALLRFCESLGKELSDLDSNITINALVPGSFQKLDGTKFKDYDHITKRIFQNIDRIICNNFNSRIIPVLTNTDKLVIFKRTIVELYRVMFSIF